MVHSPDTVGIRVALDNARQHGVLALSDVDITERFDDARRVAGGDVTHDDRLTGGGRLAAARLVLGDDAELVRAAVSQVRHREARLVDLQTATTTADVQSRVSIMR